MQLSVRDVNEEVFQEFKAKAVSEHLTVGKAMTLAMKQWMHIHEPKKSFLRLKPISFGKGTENLSRNIDKELYS